MLLELSIRNIALIEQLHVGFAPGLNVLTGETGAGKSIVVDSVNMALGARSNRELLRTGADSATVQAVFELREDAQLFLLLREMGIACDGVLTIARELSANGRSLCRVQGEVMPLQKFRQITRLLVDVHGQHEHQALLDPLTHMAYLDAYGHDGHQALIARVAERHQAYAETRREIDRLNLNASERERRVDMLTFQVSEIEAVKPKPGEDEKLEQKNNLLRNAERIAGGIQSAYQLVYKGEGKAMAAQDALKRAADAMQQIAPIDERFKGLSERLSELYYQVQDVGYELGDLMEGIEYDPALMEKIDGRLSELRRLKRKYGPELSDVLVFLARIKGELEGLDLGDEHIAELKAELKKRRAALDEACRQLTESREALGVRFSEMLVRELGELGMARTRFDVRFERIEPTELGADRIEFLLSPNPGEPLKPLSAIASGGELARIMLAMKAISADSAGVDTMIFDEIDTGVSGRMAQTVGEKMAKIARNRQVICVTHLPQIAALGQAHFVVEKTVIDERTGSGVRRLDDAGRVMELARLLGGAGDERMGRAYAEEMFRAAQELLQ